MKTTYYAKPGEVQRDWVLIDAAEGKDGGMVLGRLATQIAMILRGKNKPIYTPHVDCGDFVIIINAKDAVLTGNKLTQKYYRTHSGYAGGLKETRYDRLMATRPTLAMTLAVRGMLAKNPTQKWQLRRLKVFAGNEHKHAAQKPEVWTVE